jgi:HEAT repeats
LKGRWRPHIAWARRRVKVWWRSFRRTGLDRAVILLKAAVVMAVFFYPVWWLHINVVSRRISEIPLSLAVAFIGVQVGAIFVQLLASSMVKKIEAGRTVRSMRLQPLIRNHIAAHLTGDQRLPQLQALRRRAVRDVEVCLVESLTAIGGETHGRLCELTVQLGYLDRWSRRARRGRRECKQAVEYLGQLTPELARPALLPLLRNPKTRLEPIVYRTLVRCASNDDLSVLFRNAADAPLSVRAMLAGELSDHATQLTGVALPAVLNDGTPRQIVGALEMAAAWRCPLPLEICLRLLQNSDPKIRAGALKLTGFSTVNQPAEQMILKALDDPDRGVQAAAITLVGRLRLMAALSRLVTLAHHSDGEICRAACMALVMLGKIGQAFLQNDLVTSDALSAGRAAESLAMAREMAPDLAEVA